MLVTRRKQSDPALAQRLDPAYWHPTYEDMLGRCRCPLVRLGDYIEQISYGPIVTGQKAERCPGGVTIVHQGQVARTGVDPRNAIQVSEDSPWYNERARLESGDIVLPRSGAASVGRNRGAIFLGDYPAVVGSFVDLVRLRGIDPCYVLLCTKTEIVWSQIHRTINGVGTPNISFDEVRSLRIPALPEQAQLDLREQYLHDVHSLHLEWLQGAQEAHEAGVRNLNRLVERLEELATRG